MAKEESKEKEEEIDYVRWLFELSNNDVAVAGGKGASLAEMFNAKMPVPPAFIITAQTFEKFISSIKEEIQDIVHKTDVDDTKQLNDSSKKVRELIEKQSFPKDMEKEILEAYDILGTEKRDSKIGGDALNILNIAKEPVFVAVRSSATTEDLAEASFAGQQETFLNIKGNTKLLNAIRKCFSSLYTPRAIYYREKRGFGSVKALVAVVVQKMINSEKSGVMFTKNPIQDNDNVVIEAVFGLGEGIVSGRINPDNYKVNRNIEILETRIADKKKALVRNSSGNTEEVRLTENKSQSPVLTESEIQRLADLGLSIEKHYKKPQDIEFAIAGGEIYIVQSRPITTTAKKETGKNVEGKVLLQGQAASPGIASGKVKIVRQMKDLEKIEKGDILVTEMTNPDMVVSMQKSDAIVTNEGGMTSHAAIVSREMGIACIVGTKEATEILKDGQIVTVDGNNGKVYEGEVGKEKKKEILPVVETKTKIKVMVDLPDYAERAAKTNCKDVGLLRLEGIIAGSGKHPLLFLAENRIEAYSKLLEKGIEQIAKHFESVWVRSSDIRSDEFRNLQGSPKEIETNPMLGFHGIRFSLKNKAILEAELLAIKKVAEKFPEKKLGIMFPQIISVEETRETRKIFEKFKKKNMQFGIMVETPAACQLIEELCDEDIDFISFGTNDLTQFTLAVDRGNENVQHIYNEMHPAVLKELVRVIEVCKAKDVETSICGQAGSKPEMAKFLVKQGIDSISVNADAAQEISKIVQQIEQEQPEEKEEEREEPKEEEKEEVEKEPTEEEQLREAESKVKEELEETMEEIDNLKSVEEKAEDIKEDLEKEGKEEQEEFPDVDIGVDVFNPQEQEIVGSIAGRQGEKIKETIIGSIVTKPKREEFPELGIEFDFFNSQIAPPLPHPESPYAPIPPTPEPEPIPEPAPEPEEEMNDNEIKEVIEEMQGQRDEEDIDVPEEIETKDEEVLDIF